MTDLEITRLCAEAMGCIVFEPVGTQWDAKMPNGAWLCNYDPLHDDVQVMALAKRFTLCCLWGGTDWEVNHYGEGTALNADLNRAICECVAKIQATKAKP